MQIIGPTNVAGYTWIAPNTFLPVETYSTTQYMGTTGICTDGAQSGENCKSRIYLVNQCLKNTDNGITTCGLIVAQSSVGQVVRGGDSGGPVYNKRPNGFLNARGVIWGYYKASPNLWAYTPIHVFNWAWGAVPLRYG